MITGVIVARTLGPNLKGIVDLTNATIGLCAMVLGLSLPSGIVYWTAKRAINQKKVARILILVALIQAGVAGLALAIIAKTPWSGMFFPPMYEPWMIPVIVLGTWGLLQSGYWRSFLSGQQRFVVTASVDIVVRTLTLVGVVAAAWVFYSQEMQLPAAIILVTVGVSIIAAVVIGILTWQWLTDDTLNSGLVEIWEYARPSYIGNLVQFINYRIDIFLIVYFVGIGQLGYYTVAVSIAQLLWLPAASLQSVMFPRLIGFTDESLRIVETGRYTRLTFTLVLLMTLGVVVVGYWGIAFLYGARFAGSFRLLVFLLPGIVALSGANILSAYISAIGKPQLNLQAALAGAVCTFVVNLGLLPVWGIQAAAVASSASYTVTALLTLWFVVRETKTPIRQFIFATQEDFGLVSRIIIGTLDDLKKRSLWKLPQ